MESPLGLAPAGGVNHAPEGQRDMLLRVPLSPIYGIAAALMNRG